MSMSIAAHHRRVQVSMLNNAPYRSLSHNGLTVEGYSRAAVQSYWRIPELRLGFDLGGQPWGFMGTPTWFVSHTHLDHISALPVYVARRRMMKMDPPTIYVPAGRSSPSDGYSVLQPIRPRSPALRSDRIEAHQEMQLSRELVVTMHAMRHTSRPWVYRLGATPQTQI